MKQLLYPERKRCRACRRYFCFEVIKGLYCSRECAGLPPLPVLPLEQLPRTCRTGRLGGKIRAKTCYFTEAEALETMAAQRHADPGLEAYECPNCLYWHLGHSYQPESVSENS